MEVGFKHKKTLVFIPDTGDKSEMEDLLAYAQEKTLNDLKKAPDRPKSKLSKEEIGAMLNEYNQYLKRKRENPNKQYY